MTRRVVIRNIDWAVVWDAQNACHAYRRGVDIRIVDDRIAGIAPSGMREEDAGAEVIDGAGRLVIPGLIDIHAHPSTEPGYRGVREDHGRLDHYMAGLFERNQAFQMSPAGKRAALEIAYCEMLRSGVTTVADLTLPIPGWEDVMRASRMRVYVAPRYHSGRWVMKSPTEIGYAWNEEEGRRSFERALALIGALERDPSGRFRGVVYPAQVDTISEEILRDSIAVARQSGRPLTTHASQSVLEFREIVRRHGKTPIQWLHDIGFLGPDATIGHAIYVDEHSAIGWHTRRDIDLLAETGTSVAHCPSPFARYGVALEDFGSYRRAGVNIGLGTDVAPHNLIEEMRLAAQIGRVAAHDIRAADTGAVFDAATIGGARALGRDDIGRLAVGAKADFVVIDLDHLAMVPVRDPLRSLVWSAAERAIRHVYVDGMPALENGRPVGLDFGEAAGILAEEQARMLAASPGRDFAGRSAETIVPLTLRVLQEPNDAGM